MKTNSKKPILIAGLGNPGKKYDQTRHNAGFRMLDFFYGQLAEKSGNGSFDSAAERRNKSLVMKIQTRSHKIILAKPQTFMNRSGETIQSLVSFHKIPLENILIIHDDIDLPVGTIRVSHDSGSAGHKGVASIIEKLGSKQFARLRIGIGPAQDRASVDTESFVLKNFSEKEEGQLRSEVIPDAAQAVWDFVDEN